MFLLLQLLFLLYSMSDVCSKFASRQEFLSPKFFMCYGMMIFFLGLYAIGWQQVVKRLPLMLAFANKAMTVFWGMISGLVFFQEKPTPGKIAGVVMVMIGVVIFAFSGEGSENE